MKTSVESLLLVARRKVSIKVNWRSEYMKGDNFLSNEGASNDNNSTN